MKTERLSSSFLLAAMLFISGCATDKGPATVEEVRPGIIAGYLAAGAYPNSLELLPPPPEPGTAEFARDEAIAKKSFAYRNTERWTLAANDADLHFPAAANHFSAAIGFEISDVETPYLYQLLRRVLADAGLATYAAKDHYQRKRPFMRNGEPTATPDEEEMLRGDGSYPSGHTAIGWAWALVLTEIVPERTDAILQRGYAYGQSRVVANVHWQSDVDTGRVIGAAAVARLHANPEFQSDLKKAKAEAARVRAE